MATHCSSSSWKSDSLLRAVSTRKDWQKGRAQILPARPQHRLARLMAAGRKGPLEPSRVRRLCICTFAALCQLSKLAVPQNAQSSKCCQPHVRSCTLDTRQPPATNIKRLHLTKLLPCYKPKGHPTACSWTCLQGVGRTWPVAWRPTSTFEQVCRQRLECRTASPSPTVHRWTTLAAFLLGGSTT